MLQRVPQLYHAPTAGWSWAQGTCYSDLVYPDVLQREQSIIRRTHALRALLRLVLQGVQGVDGLHRRHALHVQPSQLLDYLWHLA